MTDEVRKDQSVSSVEFARRLSNIMCRTVDPSFVEEALCKKNLIRYSEIPSPKGNRKDVIMIPSEEIDQAVVILTGEPEETYLSMTEAASLLETNASTFKNAILKGKVDIPFEWVPSVGRGGRARRFKKSDLLKWKEKAVSTQKKEVKETPLPEPEAKPEDDAFKKILESSYMEGYRRGLLDGMKEALKNA